MVQQDDLLENALQRLDAGESLDDILPSLPADEPELAGLLCTAAQIRSAGHPALDPLKAQAQRKRVIAAAGSGARSRRISWKWIGALTSLGLAGAAVFAFLLLAFGTPPGARTATLADIQGVVEVASSPEAQDWTVASEGQSLRQGQVVRTRPDSRAALVYFEGSRTLIEPDTALLIEQLGGHWRKTLMLQLRQLYGETSHQVVRLRGGSAFYRVLTPAGIAEVHGTAFAVDVIPDDGVYYAVDRGRVAVSEGDTTVFLTAGQATLVEPQSTPDEPAYAFFIQGMIQAIEDNTWVIAGVPIRVDDTLADGFQVGDWVLARGRILPDGAYLADRLTYAKNNKVKLRFTGVIESISNNVWIIGGKTITVNEQTEFSGDLSVGDVVSVNFAVQKDGSWLAKEIEALEQEEESEEPTPSPVVAQSLTPETSPTGTVKPITATPEVSVTPEPTFEGERAGCGGGEWQHPEGLRLATRWGVSYNEIMSWFCQGYGFGEIDLAYEMAQQSGRPVAEIFAMRASGMGWGNIKKTVEPKLHPQPTPKMPQHGKPTQKPKPDKQKP